jgi:Lon protease-like protein
MYELPIFPLNTVLFPGAPLQLHIFEERYKRMIGLCLQNRQPFGVALIRSGVEAHGPLAQPHWIGCSALIVHVQRLEEGRMNIIAVGQERFRILSLDLDGGGYLVANVEPFPLKNPTPEALDVHFKRLRTLVDRFVKTLVEAGGAQLDMSQLPQDPVMLAYMAAAVLQISSDEKQELLALHSADELFNRLKRIYSRETALLEILLSQGKDTGGVSFSSN